MPFARWSINKALGFTGHCVLKTMISAASPVALVVCLQSYKLLTPHKLIHSSHKNGDLMMFVIYIAIITMMIISLNVQKEFEPCACFLTNCIAHIYEIQHGRNVYTNFLAQKNKSPEKNMSVIKFE